MSCVESLLRTLTLLSCFATIQGLSGCTLINIACEATSDNLYRFPHTCPADGTLYIQQDGRTIAYARPISDPSSHQYLHKGMKIDNSTFYNVECVNVTMKCTFPEGGRVRDKCMDYNKTIEATEEPDSSNPPLGPILGSVVGVLLLIAAVIIFKFRKRIWDSIHVRMKKTDVSCLSRNTQGTFQNGIRGPDEQDDNERNAALEDDAAQSFDPQAGETSVGHDTIVIVDDTRDADGGTNVPDEVPNRRDMQRNQRDDPGGANRIKTSDTVKIEEMQKRLSHGGREPEDDEQTERSERKQLLPVLEGANPDLDMTGEAAVLVDKSCSSPDPGSKCSIALDTDVGSARYIRNPGIIY